MVEGDGDLLRRAVADATVDAAAAAEVEAEADAATVLVLVVLSLVVLMAVRAGGSAAGAIETAAAGEDTNET